MAAEAGGLQGAAARGTARPAALRRLPWHAFRRLTWGVADQAMSSVSNFAISLYIARAVGATQFGAFSLAYVTYSFVITASRGLATDPLMVRFSGTDEAAWRRAVTRCTGTSTMVGLIAAVCVLAASAALSGSAKLGFVALGLTLPALTLQDSWRYAFFALGRGGQAFLNDTIWTVGLVPGLVFLRVTGRTNVFWFIFVWGAAAAVAALAGPFQARAVPQLTAAWSWVRQHRDLSFRYLAENTSNSGAGQLRAYGIGLILGLAAVGYVQAANTLMGPFLVIFMGMSLVTVPEAARVLRSAPRHLRLFCLLVGCGLALAGLAWGVVLLVALPRGLGQFVLGSLWRPTYPLVLPLTISVMGACFSAGATAGLHALGAARRSLRAMALASLAYLGFGLLGAALGGSMGVVRGAAVATWVGALVWWWQLHLGLRESGHLPATRRRVTAARPLIPAVRRPAPAQGSGRHRKPSAPPHPPRPPNRS
jgi:O-antigen/teichoic acid export membrane protein